MKTQPYPIFTLLPVAAAAFLLLGSCGDRGAPESPPVTQEQFEAAVETGNAASQALVEGLSSQLKAALASGGPETAIRVCQQAALPITEAAADRFEGVTIRRTSLKPRNPANQPDAIDRRVLEAWQKLADAGKAIPDSEVIQAGAGTLRFYKPIRIQAVCLNCHGPADSLKPELKTLLDELYPGDRARGYREGDLRGAIRAEMPAGNDS